MKCYCVGCHRVRDDYQWKYKSYEVETSAGVVKESGWFCGRHGKVNSPEFYNQKQGDRVREDREKHATDTVQPWRDGKPSQEFNKLYPHQAKKFFTPKERKEAKDVWRDVKGLKKVQEPK